MIKPEEIDRLTEKLSSGQDITEKEASGIKKRFSEKSFRTILNPCSRYYNLSLSDSLQRWYRTVKKSMEDGRKGNFLNTVFLYPYKVCDRPLKNMLKICLNNPFLDDIDKAKEIYLSKEYAEEVFKKGAVKLEKNIVKTPSTQQHPLRSYIFNFSFCGEARRIGLHSFVRDFTENYAPVPFENENTFFEFYYDEIFSDSDYLYHADKERLRQFFIGKAIYQSKINPIVVKREYDVFLYVPKERLPLVELWLKVPIEEVINKILASPKAKTIKKINELINILDGNKNKAVYGIPQEVISMGAQTMMKLAEIKSDKERVRNEHIDEDMLEMIR